MFILGIEIKGKEKKRLDLLEKDAVKSYLNSSIRLRRSRAKTISSDDGRYGMFLLYHVFKLFISFYSDTIICLSRLCDVYNAGHKNFDHRCHHKRTDIDKFDIFFSGNTRKHTCNILLQIQSDKLII